MFSYEISEVMPKYVDSIRVRLFKTKYSEKAFDNERIECAEQPSTKKFRMSQWESVFSVRLAVAHIALTFKTFQK